MAGAAAPIYVVRAAHDAVPTAAAPSTNVAAQITDFTATFPVPSAVAPTVEGLVAVPVAQHVDVVATISVVPVASAPLTCIAMVCALSLIMYSRNTAYPAVCGLLQLLFSHAKSRKRWPEVLDSIAARGRAQDYERIPP